MGLIANSLTVFVILGVVLSPSLAQKSIPELGSRPVSSPATSALAPVEQAPQARVLEVQGRVRIQRSGSRLSRALKPGDSLGIGDRIQVPAIGSAKIQYWDGVEVRLEPGTELEVRDRLAPEDEALRIFLGEVLIELDERLEGRKPNGKLEVPFKIRLPRAIAGAEGTRFRVRVRSDGSSRVAVFEGVVSVVGDQGETASLGQSQFLAISKDGGLLPVRALGPAWVTWDGPGVRRERTNEPFFGEVGELRSQTYLAAFDRRREALENPALVASLDPGEGLGLVEFAVAPRQGHVTLSTRDLPQNARATGFVNRSEARDSKRLFLYRALDQGRWAGALQLGSTLGRTQEEDRFTLPGPGGLAESNRLSTRNFGGLLQRAFPQRRGSWGIGASIRREDGQLRRVETFGAPVQTRRQELDALEESKQLSVGRWIPLSPQRDLGIVLRFEEREFDLGSGPSPLDRNAWSASVRERRVHGDHTFGARAFYESARFRQLERDLAGSLDGPLLDRSRAAKSELFGVGWGWGRNRSGRIYEFLDLSWQRRETHFARDHLGAFSAGARGEELQDLYSLHLSRAQRFRGFDFRAAWQLDRIHERTQTDFVVPGVAPRSEAQRRWSHRWNLTLGIPLARQTRFELQFEEREPDVPERVFFFRLSRGF